VSSSDAAILDKITDIQHTVRGLMTEVELWRVHTASTGDFILREIEELLKIVAELKAKLLEH